MYSIQVFDPESGDFLTVFESDYTVRVLSDRYGQKVVFESDDHEFNGE